MRVDRDRGLVPVAFFVMLMLMIFNTNCCRATVLIEKKNTSFWCSGGRLDNDDCSLIAEDMELELLTDSYINRMLIDPNGKATIDFTKDAHKTPPCGPNSQHDPCMDGKKVPENCSIYNRNC